MTVAFPSVGVKVAHQDNRCNSQQDAHLEMVETLRRARLLRPADLIANCGSNEVTDYCGCGNSLRIRRHRCRQFLCPSCQRIKGFKVAKEVEAIIELLRGNVPGLGIAQNRT